MIVARMKTVEAYNPTYVNQLTYADIQFLNV
jgi:hypothetical protein